MGQMIETVYARQSAIRLSHHHVYDWTNVHLGWANTARRTVKYRAGVMLNNASMHC